MTMLVHSNKFHNEVIYHVGSSFSNPKKYCEIHYYAQLYFTRTPWINRDGKDVKVSELTILSSMASFRKYMFFSYMLPQMVS